LRRPPPGKETTIRAEEAAARVAAARVAAAAVAKVAAEEVTRVAAAVAVEDLAVEGAIRAAAAVAVAVAEDLAAAVAAATLVVAVVEVQEVVGVIPAVVAAVAAAEAPVEAVAVATPVVAAAGEVRAAAVVGRAEAKADGLVEAAVAATGSIQVLAGAAAPAGAFPRIHLSFHSPHPARQAVRRVSLASPSIGTRLFTRQEVPLECAAWSRGPTSRRVRRALRRYRRRSVDAGRAGLAPGDRSDPRRPFQVRCHHRGASAPRRAF
jgi:hypothetical protein